MPAEAQEAEGEEPEGGEEEQRGEGEDGPGGAGGEGLEAGLGGQASARVSVVPRRARAAARAAEGERPRVLLFGGEVGEVVGEFGKVAADVAGSDAGAEEALAEVGEGHWGRGA